MIERYRGISFEDFAGRPMIGTVPQVTFARRDEAHDHAELLSGYWFRCWSLGYGEFVVADTEQRVTRFIAADERGDSKLWTHPDFRRRGLGEELAFSVCVRTGVMVRSWLRTAESHRLYRRVYDRIQRALLEKVAA